ncbi:hypothetical protein Riv7116_0419 [Rivularia sp. PCC 7116]|uniref:hypothetical protein n=1 Tax=Rivularia sp. PCC 7116 TaxID=373994 RepID=UPI00029F3E67|nr:hypothetical protein [Rivularia sp. PCC 7116]AFY53022.1 hypothetical protein Riv7116_0419 [Rivularia sp. PCC 7116]
MYKYVGAEEIRETTAHLPPGSRILSTNDIDDWIRETKQQVDASGLIAATFVVDCEGYLIIADRHSEHIACAGGKRVLSAGEIFFQKFKNDLEIAEITNQSTGFCPEPESWQHVANALNLIKIPYPSSFNVEFIFRRCFACSQINIVKDNIFICSVCKVKLPQKWNFDR